MKPKYMKKTILITVSIAIFAILFYTVCDDNGVKVVTPDVRTFTDKRDGKTYKEVTIGGQRWMAENLRYEADGSKCLNCEIYGRLYDWNTAMNGERSSNSNPSGVEGVCPVGWHIPSDAEWTELTDYVGENAGTKLKSRDWKSGGTGPGGMNVPDGTDKYRFSALPGGMGSHANGRNSFIHAGWNGFWWSATEMESDDGEAWNREIMGTNINVMRGHFEKHYYLSVRCVHD
jgi:uncharacterized protein (TIGR02145 family)